ncbi:MAG: L,D-transpeptidase family protein [Chthoniobacterales bacterium]
MRLSQEMPLDFLQHSTADANDSIASNIIPAEAKSVSSSASLYTAGVCALKYERCLASYAPSPSSPAASFERSLLCFRFLFSLLLLLLAGCVGDRDHKIVVSIYDQKMVVFGHGRQVASYPVSTSKYGVGDVMGSCKTPLGHFAICKKIGKDAPAGMVFKDAKPTGEILAPNAAGRDPIVTRIFWLTGKEPHNQNAYKRCIYIHGTPEERCLGLPRSYGCIRMSSADAIRLDQIVGRGAEVEIIEGPLK